jgi:hypothetical protein
MGGVAGAALYLLLSLGSAVFVVLFVVGGVSYAKHKQKRPRMRVTGLEGEE